MLHTSSWNGPNLGVEMFQMGLSFQGGSPLQHISGAYSTPGSQLEG